MDNTFNNPFSRNNLSKEVIEQWQDIVNLMADIFEVPAGLIMRIDGPEIEVFTSSMTPGNPYKQGEKENFINSGLYCEWVSMNRKQLLVPDARKDPDWDKNPDIKLNMVSYLGMPIMLPDKRVFGTICVLDSKENKYTEKLIKLLEKFKLIVESSLLLIHQKEEIEQRDKVFRDLSRIFSICAYCKKVRNASDEWVDVENYIKETTGEDASHSICPECYEKVSKQIGKS